jgi:hypothetical protein
VIPHVAAASHPELSYGGARAASVSGQLFGRELKGGTGAGGFEHSTPPPAPRVTHQSVCVRRHGG